MYFHDVKPDDDEPELDHPENCLRVGCRSRNGGDIVHHYVPEAVIAPGSRDDIPISFALVRYDEIGPDGRQIVHDTDAVVIEGQVQRIYNDLDELRGVGDYYHSLADIAEKVRATATARRPAS